MDTLLISKIKLYCKLLSVAKVDTNSIDDFLLYDSIQFNNIIEEIQKYKPNLLNSGLKSCVLTENDFSEDDKLYLNIAIVGYKSDIVGKWDPSNTVTGLPGSEECAVYAAEELASRGHKITVYMNPADNSLWNGPFSNPRWIDVDLWDKKDNYSSYDLVLMWRRYDPDSGRKRGNYVFFWPHDSPSHIFNFPKYDGVCVLSDHHRRQFSLCPGFNSIPYTICGNGIIPKHFDNPMQFTNPYSIGYFSNYARGLINLILIWPEIRKLYPEATLSICYGRETWNTMPVDQFQFVIDKIDEYKDMGITEHGKVGHKELALIMQKTSIWAYPCNYLGWTETFCITAVKCQAAGCIPVTTRIGALNETVHPEAPQIPLIQNESDVEDYKQLLLTTLSRIQDTDVKAERLKYITFAHKFSWSACINHWLTLYQRVTNPEIIMKPIIEFKFDCYDSFIDSYSNLNFCTRKGTEYSDHIMKNGIYDYYNIEWCKEFINPESVFVDIGAHIGTYSMILSSHCKEVHAFEPQTSVFECLNIGICNNNRFNIQVYNTALGSNDCNSSLYHFSDDTSDITNYGNINITTLDKYQIIGIDFMKIDVKGYEIEILRGASQTLINNNYPPFIFNTLVNYKILSGNPNDTDFDINPDHQESVFSYVKSLGYNIVPIIGYNNYLYLAVGHPLRQ